MTITTIDSGIYPTFRCAEFVCGKTRAYVQRHDDGRWRVLKFTSHDQRLGTGRGFASHAEAVAGYKQPEMKAILEAAPAMLGV